MKQLIYLLLILFSNSNSFAQIEKPNESFGISINSSQHGTGDLSGILFTTEYTRFFSKRYSWGLNMGGTIHDREFEFGPYDFIDDQTDKPTTRTIRQTTAGFQIGGNIGYNVLLTNNHHVFISTGLLSRFQSAQKYNGFGVGLANTPTAKYIFYSDVNGHQRTYTLGYSLKTGYVYSINRKMKLGIQLGLQNDTEGDVITFYGFTVGRKF